MRTLVWIGLILIVFWLLAWLVFKLTGFLVNLLLIAGVLLVILWLAQRLGGPG